MDNPSWGGERIANELLLKLGLRVSPRTVGKYMTKRPAGKPRSRMPVDNEPHRKLAAILSADVVGYSRLMGADEPTTIETLTAYRAAMRCIIEHHNGRVVNALGDALLARVRQRGRGGGRCGRNPAGLKGRTMGLAAERRMHFCIGVNLGDVIEQDTDNSRHAIRWPRSVRRAPFLRPPTSALRIRSVRRDISSRRAHRLCAADCFRNRPGSSRYRARIRTGSCCRSAVGRSGLPRLQQD